jgi:hypothetical protein
MSRRETPDSSPGADADSPVAGGARRRAARRRRWRRRAIALVALGATAAAVYVGVSGRGPEPATTTVQPSSSPTPTETPLATLDVSKLPIERAPFCHRLEQGDVETALGGPVSATHHYSSGDRVELEPGVTDVSHEYDCTFDAAGGTQARVWVFAEPVTRSEAAGLTRDARREKGCSTVKGAPAYGTPSATTTCRSTRPASTTVTSRGLFGDAWMSCRLRVPGRAAPAEAVRRGEQWCLKVATTLGARP